MIEELNRKAIQDPENKLLILGLNQYLRTGQGIDYCWPIIQWFYTYARIEYSHTEVWHRIYNYIQRQINTIAGFPTSFEKSYISRKLKEVNIERYEHIAVYDRLRKDLGTAIECYKSIGNFIGDLFYSDNYEIELDGYEKVIREAQQRKKRESLLKREAYEALVKKIGREKAGIQWYGKERKEYLKNNPNHIVLKLTDKVYLHDDLDEGLKVYHPSCYFPFYQYLGKERLNDFSFKDATGEREEDWDLDKKLEMSLEMFGRNVYEDKEYDEDLYAVEEKFDRLEPKFKKEIIEEYLDNEVIPEILNEIETNFEEMTVLQFLKEYGDSWSEGAIYSSVDGVYDEWYAWSPRGNIKNIYEDSRCNIGGLNEWDQAYPACEKVHVVKIDIDPFTISELFGSRS